MSKKGEAGQVGIYVRVDPALAKRIDAERVRVERRDGGHVPTGTLVRRLAVEALDARAATSRST